MSINLHLKAPNGEKYELWQTPTYITEMILTGDGNQNILQRYLLWVRYQGNAMFNANSKDPKAQEDSRERTLGHLRAVREFCECHGIENVMFYKL